MRKTKKQPKHSVRAKIKILSLTKAGSSIQLEVFAEDRKIGTVIIGRGSLTWVRGHHHKEVSGIRKSWTDLADWFERS